MIYGDMVLMDGTEKAQGIWFWLTVCLRIWSYRSTHICTTDILLLRVTALYSLSMIRSCPPSSVWWRYNLADTRVAIVLRLLFVSEACALFVNAISFCLHFRNCKRDIFRTWNSNSCLLRSAITIQNVESISLCGYDKTIPVLEGTIGWYAGYWLMRVLQYK